MKRSATIILSLLVELSARSFAAPPLKDILNALEQANSQIGVVKVEGHTHEYLWDDSASSWRITPQTSAFSCTFENKPNGRFVLSEDPSLTRWTQGAAPYFAEWSTEYRDADGFITCWRRAFQHHDGTHFLSTRFESDEVARSKQSEFYKSYAQRAERFYSGLDFTGLKAVKNTPVYAPERFKGIVVSDTNDGMTRIQYTEPERCLRFDFVLDPRKNFALLRYVYSVNRELTTADEELTVTYEVLEHRQIADGVWYPVRCMHTTKVSKEYTTVMRSQLSQRGLPDPGDHCSSRRAELVLTIAAILTGDDAEKNLTVKLPDGVAIRNEDEQQ